MITIREATKDDAIYLSTRLRDADRLEVKLAGNTPLGSLMDGLELGDMCMCAVDQNGKPLCMFGVVSITPHVGAPWLLGTEDMFTTSCREFITASRSWLIELGKRYRVLTNAVHARNKRHVEWLKWMGFTFIERFHFSGAPFLSFGRLTGNV